MRVVMRGPTQADIDGLQTQIDGKLGAEDLLSAPIVSPASNDYVVISDVSDGGDFKRALVSNIGSGGGGLTPEVLDENTVIIEAQRKSGAFPKLDSTKTKFAWSDWQALILFAAPSGALYGFGGAAYGYFS